MIIDRRRRFWLLVEIILIFIRQDFYFKAGIFCNAQKISKITIINKVDI